MNNPVSISSKQTRTSSWANSLWFRILLIAALGLGVLFRLAGLGNKLYSHDEAHTSLRAAGYTEEEAAAGLWDGREKTVEEVQKFLRPGRDKDVLDTLSITALYGPHQAPLFYVLAYYWMRAVGESPAAMRGLAVLFSLLAIPAMYWLGRELFLSTGTALLAAAFFALSPYQVLFAQDARPYSIWTLATITASAALMHAMQKNTWRAWLLYSFTLIFGMYSHQLFALVAIVHALYFAGKDTLRSPKAWGGFLSAAVVAFLAFTPWLYFVIQGWNEAVTRMAWANMTLPWYRYIQRWVLNFSSPFLDLDTGSNLVPYLLRALLLLLVVFAWIFLLRHASFRQKKFLLLMFIIPAGFFMLPDVLQGGIRSISGRYYVPASIVTILVMSYFLAGKLDRARPNTLIRWQLLTGILLLAGLVSNLNSLYAETWWNKELGRVTPQFIDEINRDQTTLIVASYHPSNLGDMLLLSLEVHPDVHFRLYMDPDEMQVPDDVQNIYLMPRSHDSLQKIIAEKHLQVSNVIPSILWRIDEAGN